MRIIVIIILKKTFAELRHKSQKSLIYWFCDLRSDLGISFTGDVSDIWQIIFY